MRWQRTRNPHLQDRRRMGGGRVAAGGGLGIVGVIVVLLVTVLGGGGGGGALGGVESPFDTFPPSEQPGESRDVPGAPDPEADLVDFVRFVAADLQTFWQRDFGRAGRDYDPAQVVLFRRGVSTRCGNATSAVGPFYCPADQTVYLDLSFFRDLAERHRAPGDFAQAYVIAHEIGHHVQTLTGVSRQVDQAGREDPSQRNDLSQRQELMADCLAGVWGRSTYERGLLESGDFEEGLAAAASVGDDRLQREATGTINPETWTHGSSEQRTRWFSTGFERGDATSCDTFSA